MKSVPGRMTDSSESSEHHGVGHLVPVKILVGTALALLVLTVITVGASFIDFGTVNIWIALGIAAVKGALVALFFMHLRWDRPFNAIVFVASLAFVAIFISFALTDTREYAPDMEAGNAPLVQEQLDAIEH